MSKRGLAVVTLVTLVTLATGLLACSSSNPAASSGGSGGSTGTGASTGTGGAGGSTGTGGGFVEAKHRAWPQLTKAGNGVMSSPRVVLIVPQNETAANAAAYQALVTAIPSSAWYAAWSPGCGIGAARPSQAAMGPAIATGTNVDLTAGAAYVDGALAAADPSLAPDGQTTYVVVLPAGVTLSTAPTSTDVSGYHFAYGSKGDGLGLIQVAADGSSPRKRSSAVVTHEIAEAISDTGLGWRTATPGGTDPWTLSVWNVWEGANAMGGFLENGDFCEGTRYAEGAQWYQRIYDDAAAAKGDDPCVPALPLPYFNVSTDQDWYPSQGGAPVTIPVTGWSTEPTGDFIVSVEVAARGGTKSTWDLQLTTPRKGTFGGKAWPVLNNGEGASLLVTPPAIVASGSWLVVSLWTWHETASGDAPAGEDTSHLFAVGVYVP